MQFSTFFRKNNRMMKVEVKKNLFRGKTFDGEFYVAYSHYFICVTRFFVCRLGFYIVHYDTFQALTLNDILMSFIKGVI